jgi:hypothetical protein
MRKERKPISEREQPRRAKQRAETPRPLDPAQLLYSRQHTAMLLGGLSVMTVIRLEKAGKLTPIKPGGHVFYRADEVRALAGIG